MTKDQIITDIRAAVVALNAAIKEANEKNIRVKVFNSFDLTSAINPSITVEIEENN